MYRLIPYVLMLGLLLWTYWQQTFILSLYLAPDTALGWDGRELFEASRVIYEGKDPFDIENFSPESKMTFPAAIYPGMILFFLPLYLTVDWMIARVILYGLNVVLAAGSVLYLLSKTSGWRDQQMGVVRIMLCVSVFLCTSPVIWTLIPGQTSLITNYLLLLALLGSCRPVRALSLALAAVLKYSLTPIFGLLLLVKREYRICFAALGLFLLLSATPVFFGHSLITLYKNYTKHVWGTLMPGGHNHYDGGAGFNFIHFEFLKMGGVNALGKAVIVISVFIALWRERRLPGISLNFLFFASCATMIPNYHRIHDLSLAVLFLIVIANYLFLQKRWVNFSFAVCFLVLLCLPIQWDLYDWIGRQIGENPWFYLGNWGTLTHIPPILGLFTYILTLYALFNYFLCDETYRFAALQ